MIFKNCVYLQVSEITQDSRGKVHAQNLKKVDDFLQCHNC